MNDVRLLKTLPVGNILGECVLWNDTEQVFYWTDIEGAKLYRYHTDADRIEHWDTPERLCSFGFVEGDEALIAAFESGIALYRPGRDEVEWLARPEAGITGTRFNDGRVDRQGRFWAGTMVEAQQAVDEQGNVTMAAVYRTARGECVKIEEGLRITNSLCWSLNAKTQYMADSPTYTIYAYDYEPAAGTPSGRRVFARTDTPIEPDGSCIDAEDHLWNAQFGGGKVVRYRPDGTVAGEVTLPVTQPTCVCFGGPYLNWLAVTSASVELDASELKRQPQAGNLFIFETPYKGLPESRYVK